MAVNWILLMYSQINFCAEYEAVDFNLCELNEIRTLCEQELIVETCFLLFT